MMAPFHVPDDHKELPNPTPARKSRRRRRVATYLGVGLLLLLVVATVVLRTKFNGEALAKVVQSGLQGSIRGKVTVGKIDWPLSDISKLVTGGWLHVEVSDLKVWDEYDDKVIDVPRATLEVDVHGAMGRKNFRFRNIRVDDGGYAFIKQVPEPYPAHEYDDSVVSLISAFYPSRSPGFSTGYSASKHSSFDLHDFEIGGKGAELEFEFGNTHVLVSEVRGGGFLYSGGNDPLGNKLYYSLAATDLAKTGAQSARIAVLPEPDPKQKEKPDWKNPDVQIPGAIVVTLRDLQVHQLGLLPSRWPAELIPRDVQYKISATGEDGLTVNLEGAVLDQWIDIYGGELQLRLDLEKAGRIAEIASGGIAGGDYLKLTLNIDGPMKAKRFKADLRNLDLHIPMGDDLPRLELEIDQAVPSWDQATYAGRMEQVVARVKDGRGYAELSASFGLDPLNFDLMINIPEAIDLVRYLPLKAASIANGTELSGRLSAAGTREQQELRELDLRLGDAMVSGTAFRQGNLVHAQGVHINLPGLDIRNIDGKVDPETRELGLSFDLALTNAARYLRLFKIKPLVKQVHGHIEVNGTIDSPTARANKLVILGVPMLDRLELSADYKDEKVIIRDAEGSALGGWIRGSGELLLGGMSPQLRGIEAEAIHLQLDQLPLIGKLLEGQLDLAIKASGSVKQPDAEVQATLSDWSLAGEGYLDTSINLEAKRNGDRRVEGTLERRLGGILHIDALVDRATRLAGIFTLRDLPLDSMLAHGSGALPKMGGSLSTEMQLGGDLGAPTFEGEITLLRAWIQTAFLGSAELAVEDMGNSQVRIVGQMFQRRVAIDCLLTTKAPYKAEISVTLRRVELDRFAPELAQQYGVRGWVSGELHYKGSLLGDKKPTVLAKLSEAEILVDNDDEDGRPSPIRLRNRTPLSLSYDGQQLAFLEAATVRGPTGDFTLQGSGSVDNLDFELAGGVAVGLIQPYLQTQFQSMSGDLVVKAQLKGSLAAPKVVGVLEINQVQLRPAGQDAIVTIPMGKIAFSNTELSVTGLRVVVKDQFSDETSELTVGGGMRLDNFMPAVWALRIEGELAGKMLLALAPEVFSAASGTASVSVALLGTGLSPDIDGTIEFDGDTPLALTPRAARRELSFTSGIIRFTDQLIELEDIQGMVDGEGQLTAINGEISLEDWKPVDVDVSVSARDLLFRIPQELELSVHLNGFSVLGGVDGLEIAGQIEIADGRYIRKFNPFLDALQPTRSTDTESSIFENLPLLGNAKLKLAVMTRAFFVDNNVGNIEFNGEVDITGTPLAPEIDGIIHVAQGRFKFQGVRAQFERTSGSVRFSPGLDIPDETPYLSIASESDYRGTDGQNHLVNLRIEGPLSKLEVDLSTSAGLNTQETFQLLLSGRTPDDVRKEFLGDEAVGRPDDFANKSTASSEGGLQALDQFTKDIAGDWFSLIIEDRLRAATKLDVARLQLGTASIGFYGEKILTRSWKFVGEIERSLSGWNWDLQTQYRLTDNLSIDLGHLEKYFDDEAEEDVSQTRLRGTIRGFFIP